jgi:hypothetical protein
VAEVDDLGAGGLRDAAEDVDRRVVTVEQAGCRDEADLVLWLERGVAGSGGGGGCGAGRFRRGG